jgi:glucose/mannose-6-phosphate isomerase
MNEKIDLDGPASYARYDPQGMLDHLHNFPAISRRAWQMGQEFKLPSDYAGVKKVVILGMGGSAIGGDLVQSFGIQSARVPVLTCRDYNLPAYVDEETLVVASSYSGATEETLSAFEQALKIKCPKLAITTGGKLKDLCQSRGLPVFSYEYRAAPRAVLPFSFFPLLAILEGLKLLPSQSAEVAECLDALDRLAAQVNEKVPEEKNQAKSLARNLAGKLAVVYGGGITRDVAQRWKTQFNENSKHTAFWESFSELNHNSVVGYSFPAQLPAQTWVVMLTSNWLHPRILLRYQITRGLLKKAGFSSVEVQGQGSGRLAQMMTLVLLGDYVSYYLALLNKVDPTPVAPIDFLKSELARSS